MLPEFDELEAVVEAMYAQADRVPARTRYLRLSHADSRRLVHVHRELIAEIEAELTRPTCGHGRSGPRREASSR
jgi:hypothetical protein